MENIAKNNISLWLAIVHPHLSLGMKHNKLSSFSMDGALICFNLAFQKFEKYLKGMGILPWDKRVTKYCNIIDMGNEESSIKRHNQMGSIRKESEKQTWLETKVKNLEELSIPTKQIEKKVLKLYMNYMGLQIRKFFFVFIET